MAQLSFIGDSIRAGVCTEASQLTWGWSGLLPSLTVMYGSSLDGLALRTQYEHMCDMKYGSSLDRLALRTQYEHMCDMMYGSSLDGLALRTQYEHMCDIW